MHLSVITLIILLCSTSLANKTANFTVPSGVSTTIRHKLHEWLLEGYDTKIRPVFNSSRSVLVTFDTNIVQLMETDPKQGILKVCLWLQLTWLDEYIGWNPEDWGGTSKVSFDNTNLWTPDAYFYERLNMDDEEVFKSFDLLVEPVFVPFRDGFTNPDPNENRATSGNTTGMWVGREGPRTDIPDTPSNRKMGVEVTQWYPAMVSFAFKFNTRYFPFDVQHGTVRMGSWMYSSRYIDMVPKRTTIPVQTSEEVKGAKSSQIYYKPSEEWKLRAVKVQRMEFTFPEVTDVPFAFIELTFHLRRRPEYYIWTLVVPNLIISVVAVTGFFTAGSSGEERIEKVNLGMATLLAKAVLLIIIAELMPATSSYQPLIGVVFLLDMVIVAAALFVACAMIEFERNPVGCRLSRRTRRFWFHGVARGLCMTLPHEIREDEEGRLANHVGDQGEDPGSPLGKRLAGRQESSRLSTAVAEGALSEFEAELLHRLSQVQRHLRAASEKAQASAEGSLWRLERGFLGRVLDRTFLLLTYVLLAITLLVLFTVGSQARHLYD